MKLTEEEKKIISENLPLIYFFYKKFISIKKPPIFTEEEKEDFFSYASYCLCKITPNYDPNYKISTYWKNAFKWCLLNYVNNRKKETKKRLLIRDGFISEKKRLLSINSSKRTIDTEFVESLFMEADLSTRARKILRLRFFRGKTLRDIGKIFGYSHEKVRKISNESIEKIKLISKENDYELKDFYLLPELENLPELEDSYDKIA